MNNLFDDEPLLDATDEIPREAFSTAVAPEEIRERAWRATSGHLRRRRLLRGALRMSAAAALFVGGIGVGLIAASGQQQVTESPHVQPVSITDAKMNDDNENLLNHPEEFALRLQTAPKPERIELLQRAGDRYLNEVGNVELAMRCYQRMLEIGPESAENVDVNDSWLLMALKFDRQREKTSHEQPNA